MFVHRVLVSFTVTVGAVVTVRLAALVLSQQTSVSKLSRCVAVAGVLDHT